MTSHERHQSAEQVLAKHVRVMGADLGRVYNALSTEFSRFYIKWNLHRQLYGRSTARIDVLNKAAGHFFGVLRRILIDDVLLHLGRMTDPERIAGRDNLTIRRLPALVPEEIKPQMEELLAAALTACEPIRPWRNRRIAHTDLGFALFNQLPLGVTLMQLQGALESLQALLNRLEIHYWQAPTMYDQIVTPPGDADALVYYLWTGLSVEEQRKQRLLSGQPL